MVLLLPLVFLGGDVFPPSLEWCCFAILLWSGAAVTSFGVLLLSFPSSFWVVLLFPPPPFGGAAVFLIPFSVSAASFASFGWCCFPPFLVVLHSIFLFWRCCFRILLWWCVDVSSWVVLLPLFLFGGADFLCVVLPLFFFVDCNFFYRLDVTYFFTTFFVQNRFL